MLRRTLIMLMSMLLLLGCTIAQGAWFGRSRERTSVPVVLGIERIGELQVAALLEGKRLGLFTNQSGVDSRLRSSVELLRERYDLQALLVPEHGLFGAVTAGEKFASSEYQGIPVLSLYGDSRRPSKEMLDRVDAVVVDIQDVGTRHYTYFSSLAYIMEECAKQKKQVIVLDRPNPLGGTVQGPVLKPEYATFIGLYPLPLRHGLTIGEFARYINEEQGIHCPLTVVPMKGYRPELDWQATALPWVQTSPRIPTMDTAYLYCITGCIGDSNINVGIGTAKPFHFVAAEFMDAAELKEALDAAHISGLAFRAAAFTPESGADKGKLLQGVELYVLDKKGINLPEAEYRIMEVLRRLYPEHISFSERGYGAAGYTIDIGFGEGSLREGAPAAEAFARWQQECADFAKMVKPYKLYQ